MSKIYTIIAAGGLGTRLQHYDASKKTKMLLEINGESMITKQISQLMSWNLEKFIVITNPNVCLLYTSPSPRDLSTSRMPSSA